MSSSPPDGLRRPSAPQPLHRGLIFGFVLAVLFLFGVSIYLTYRYVEQTRSDRLLLERSHRVVDLAARLRIVTLDSAVRVMYHITDLGGENPTTLKLTVRQIPATLSQLRLIAQDDQVQKERLDRIDEMLAVRTRLLEELIDRPWQGGFEERRRLLAQHNLHINPARAAIMAFLRREEEKLIERQRTLEQSLRHTIWLLVAALVGAMIASVAAIFFFVGHQRLQRLRFLELSETNDRMQQQHDALLSAERRLRAILDNGLDSIMLVSPDGEIVLANLAAANRLRLDRNVLLGERLDRFLPGFDIAENRHWSGDAVCADDTHFPAEVTVGECQLDKGPAYVCIMRDVTERQQLQQVKDEFVATVSHELRTPLTSIRGSLGLIVSNAAGDLPPKARGLLEIAHKNTIRLIDLVNDLLDIEKIETHRIEMEKERLDFGKLVRATVEANQGFARQFNSELVFRDETMTPAQIMGNAGRLQQVLSNLISNAVKFTPAGSATEVTLKRTVDSVIVEVRDFGAGIPDSFKPNLFKRFAQADSGNTRRSRGTGLGLSIVKAIIDRHDGTVDFESPVPGGGTRFWITLPLALDEPRPAEMINDHRPCVLICEDDAVMGRMLAIAVEQDGWRPVAVTNAEDALARLARTRFAAMTVDLTLPDMSGIELIRHVRADERHHLMPIIVVSVSPPERRHELGDEVQQSVEWLTKPVTESTLRKVLDGCVNMTGRLRILHVEDHADTVVIVREILRNVAGEDVQVEVASSLKTARELLEQRRFDLVILDVHLSDGNGLDLIPLLRTTNQQAALLILSAEDVQVRGSAMIQASLNKARMENAQLATTIGRLLAETRRSRLGEDQDGHRAA